MSTELRVRNQSQMEFLQSMSQVWRNGVQLHDPSLWLLRDHEAEEKMLRDADIAHAVGYRRHAIAGKRWNLAPKIEGSARAPMSVSVGTQLIDHIKHFTNARFMLARAFFSGARFARIHGRYRTMTLGDGKPRTWWVPTRLEDLDKRMYRIVPDRDEDDNLTAHWERWDIARSEWRPETMRDAMMTIRHVYQDDQASLGHGKALREALGWWWYAKTHVFQESLQAVERFAQGIVTAKVDGIRDAATGLPNSELIAKWKNVLEDFRSRHVLVHDSADQIEIIDGSGTGWELLSEMRGELRSTIFTLVMGANLTTSANEGGSYALAEVQENSTEMLIQYDRETLEETLTDDLMGCIWHRNHANMVELGIADEKPRFTIIQEKREDPQERANVASTLVQMGVDLPLDDVLEQTGFRKPEPGEEVVKGGQQQMPGMMPGMFKRQHMAGDHDESKHPRDKDGKFEPKEGGGDDGGKSDEKPKKKVGQMTGVLNNTPSIAKKSYIHPGVFEEWKERIGYDE